GPVLLVAVAALAVVGVRAAGARVYRLYPPLMNAGLWLKDHAPPGRVGAWNAGILNFFEGGDVVNLDGLTNDDVVPYIMADKLHCYVLEKDIRYVMDFEMMVGGNCTLRHRAGC